MKIPFYNTFLILFLFACAASPVRRVKLFSNEKGFDVRCNKTIQKCESFAHSLCKGRYRIHNIAELGDFTMRFECIESEQDEKECREIGVSCVVGASSKSENKSRRLL